MLSPLPGAVPVLSRVGSDPDLPRNRANVRHSPHFGPRGAARRVLGPADACRAVSNPGGARFSRTLAGRRVLCVVPSFESMR